ncbi:hypothetical protein EDB81DRAFT_509132 [Dactylonectria macrodidyma]|uniref:Uncharacterized protein n=1 Tax=Dactylonectria macrodidyma TaxID=307937 RepID=A0A9P9ETV2_9HYPO|nr:hypothetical protein EDB81DRAFT_509132 [Dactylonectria macrodidyma]
MRRDDSSQDVAKTLIKIVTAKFVLSNFVLPLTIYLSRCMDIREQNRSVSPLLATSQMAKANESTPGPSAADGNGKLDQTLPAVPYAKDSEVGPVIHVPCEDVHSTGCIGTRNFWDISHLGEPTKGGQRWCRFAMSSSRPRGVVEFVAMCDVLLHSAQRCTPNGGCQETGVISEPQGTTALRHAHECAASC